MPGETRNYTFKLPIAVADIETIDIRFYQDESKIVEYDEENENVYGIEGEGNESFIVCSLPREDTLKFENKVPAQVQLEWYANNYHSVAKAKRISVGTYIEKDYMAEG